jgi:hypothetical protein
MNAARTDLQKQIRAQRAELVRVQEAIADRRPLPLPDGKKEHHYKHPTIPSFYLRQYESGRGRCELQYRVKATGEKRTLNCGEADVTTLVQAPG